MASDAEAIVFAGGITFNDGTTMSTAAGAGADGEDGVDGSDGKGFTGGSYDTSTGIVTFTSNDGLGFATGDLRGATGATGQQGEQGEKGEKGDAGNDGEDGQDGSNATVTAGTGIAVSDGEVSLSAGLNNLSDVAYKVTSATNSLWVGTPSTGTINNASYNTSVGALSGDALTGGDNNSSLGYRTLTSVTTGSGNTAVGADAGDKVVQVNKILRLDTTVEVINGV